MEPDEAKRWLISIIKQRMHIERVHGGHRNSALMYSICERLTKYLQAYPFQGNKILTFIMRNSSDITLIIPGNRQELQNIKKLNEICQQVYGMNTPASTTPTRLPRQLELFF